MTPERLQAMIDFDPAVLLRRLRCYEPLACTLAEAAFNDGPKTALAYLITQGWEFHRLLSNGVTLVGPGDRYIFVPRERLNDYGILTRDALRTLHESMTEDSGE